MLLCSLLQESITQERSQWERIKLQENNHINQENALIEKQKVISISSHCNVFNSKNWRPAVFPIFTNITISVKLLKILHIINFVDWTEGSSRRIGKEQGSTAATNGFVWEAENTTATLSTAAPSWETTVAPNARSGNSCRNRRNANCFRTS